MSSQNRGARIQKGYEQLRRSCAHTNNFLKDLDVLIDLYVSPGHEFSS